MMTAGKHPTLHQPHSFSHLPGSDPHHSASNDLPHLPISPGTHMPRPTEKPASYDRPLKRRKTVAFHNFSQVGSNMAKYGHGIFKSPYPSQDTSALAPVSSILPILPPKDTADSLLQHYRCTIHPTLPMLRWNTFREQYEAVYRDGSLRSVSQIWGAVLFAVFACGSLQRSWAEGQKYIEISTSLIDLRTEYLTLDFARATLLNCIFRVESNLKSSGWIWIGIAVRICFDIGLNCEAGKWDAIEEEMRRRVWWSVYACDWSV